MLAPQCAGTRIALHKTREALSMMTKDPRPHAAGSKAIFAIVAGLALAFAVLTLAGCSGDQGAQGTDAAAEEELKGFGMGGVDQQVAIPAEWLRNQPEPWDLGTPETAVRSYLDWVSYAYRITESDAASATQSAYQLVRTDAYIQANLQEQRLLDQTLVSLEFGPASVEGSTAVIPAEEEWTYRYVSIVEAGETLDGPHTANYETTYTLVKEESGWVVDDIEVKPMGDIK